MYQELMKQKVDLGLRKPFKQETVRKIMRLNELDYIYGGLGLDGTDLTRQEIRGMMEGDIPGTASLKECVFVKNYMNVIEEMRHCLALKTSLDKKLLLKFHSILIGGESEFRRSNPTVTDFHHVPPHASEVESGLNKLLQNAYRYGANEIRSASRIHYGILSLYPFETYSEVMARMAMNYYLQERGFMPVALGYNRHEYLKTMIECLKDKDDILFFWGLERAEYNKMAQILQIVENDSEEEN